MDTKLKIAVLTSGGDAPGMNAAVRAVVRTALHMNAEAYVIKHGYRGMVDGGDNYRKMTWQDVSNLLHKGGTEIGTARCLKFKDEKDDTPKLQAVRNLLDHGIDRMVIIGGDGSLTGAMMFSRRWPELVEKVIAQDESYREKARRHPQLYIVGLIGSIDNDMYGSDLTIGVDTALHRILQAVDAINSTAVSHQRTFVVEVMGNRCGYLALMSALVTGADFVFIPEKPHQNEKDGKSWEEKMCDDIRRGRAAGRKAAIVILAEGATDADGNKIFSHYVTEVLESKLKEDARVTILGHVQRGGSPSAYDRYMSTIVGYMAACKALSDPPPEEPLVAGLRGNEVVFTPLEKALRKTREVAEAIEVKDYDRAMRGRGKFVNDIFEIANILSQPEPQLQEEEDESYHFAILHSGPQSPGMNTAVRAAVRLLINKGHRVFGVRHGFKGLLRDSPLGDDGIFEMDWMYVNRWASMGGAELGTNRVKPETEEDFRKIAQRLGAKKINGLLVIGGWTAYESAYQMYQMQNDHPQFNIPIVCLPATISNRLPGTEVCIGSDTALNNIVDAVDKIKQSAVGINRCFITEVAGLNCGYLALISAIATGAERAYLHEDNITLADIQKDLNRLIEEFREGRELALIIRNEKSHKAYDTAFMTTLFDEESGELFGAKHSILGHLQHGGSPSPFDRILATLMASHGVKFLVEQAHSPNPFSAFIGVQSGKVIENNLNTFPAMVDWKLQRPLKQWWLPLREIAEKMSHHPK